MVCLCVGIQVYRVVAEFKFDGKNKDASTMKGYYDIIVTVKFRTNVQMVKQNTQ